MGKAWKVSLVLLVVLSMGCGGKDRRTVTYSPRDYKFTQKYIDVNGLKMSYIEEGVGGDTVVLVHGVGGSLNNWDYNIEAFAAKHRVIAVDLPGHGNSERPNIPYSVKLHMDYLYQFLKAKNINKATLVGHTMGGQIAVMLALKHPEMVERLVLIAPSGADVYLTSGLNWIGSRQYVRRSVTLASRVTSTHYNNYEKIVWTYMERDGKHGYATALVYDANSHPTNEFLKNEIKYYYDFMASPEFPKFVKAIRKSAVSIPRQFIREDLHKIKAPTLIIWGKEDGIMPFVNVTLFNDFIPTSMMSIFPKCGHMVMVEKPDRFNRIVLEFIR